VAYAACLRPWCYLFNVTYDVISTHTHQKKMTGSSKMGWGVGDGILQIQYNSMEIYNTLLPLPSSTRRLAARRYDVLSS